MIRRGERGQEGEEEEEESSAPRCATGRAFDGECEGTRTERDSEAIFDDDA